jgi:hypothetical protein
MDSVSDAHATANAYIHLDFNKYADANCQLHAHIDIDPKPYADNNVNAYTYCMDAHTYKYAPSYLDSFPNSNTASNSDVYSYTFKNSNIDLDSHLYTFTNTYPYENSNCNRVAYSIENAHCIHYTLADSDIYAKFYRDDDAHANSHPYSALCEDQYLFH